MDAEKQVSSKGSANGVRGHQVTLIGKEELDFVPWPECVAEGKVWLLITENQ